MDQLSGRTFRFKVELGQAAQQEPPGSLRGVGAPETDFEHNESAVGVLADRVQVDCPL